MKPGDRQQRGRNRALGGHQHGRRGRQAQRPGCAQSQIGSSPGGAVVHALHTSRHFARQQPAEDEAQSPGNERASAWRTERSWRSRCVRSWGSVAKAAIRRFTGGVVATTYPPMMIITICMVNGTKRPEVLDALDRQFAGRLTQAETDQKHEYDSQQREYQGIGKPALAPVCQSSSRSGLIHFR